MSARGNQCYIGCPDRFYVVWAHQYIRTKAWCICGTCWCKIGLVDQCYISCHHQSSRGGLQPIQPLWRCILWVFGANPFCKSDLVKFFDVYLWKLHKGGTAIRVDWIALAIKLTIMVNVSLIDSHITRNKPLLGSMGKTLFASTVSNFMHIILLRQLQAWCTCRQTSWLGICFGEIGGGWALPAVKGNLVR